MPYCMNCGQKLPDDSKFCSVCGTLVSGEQTHATGNAASPVPDPAPVYSGVPVPPVPDVQANPQYSIPYQNMPGNSGSSGTAKPKSKNRLAVIAVICIVLVVTIVCGVVFFGIPYLNYRSACKTLDNGNYDAAYAAFCELGSFMDSEEMANEALYQKASEALEDQEYDQAIQIFDQLGDYRNSPDQLLEAKYRKADELQNLNMYKAAYELFLELGSYKQSQEEVLATILLWESAALGGSSTTVAEAFCDTVKLTSSQYDAYYTTILLFLNAHEDAEYWYSWGATTASKNVDIMLTLLPSSYSDTSILRELFYLLSQDYGEYDVFFRENPDLMRQCWSLPFVQDLAAQDSAIYYFLESYWTGSGYYLNFYESEDGSTYSTFDLPWVAKPYGTQYYNIENMVFYWDNGNNEHLAKVFHFEIVDYDTIRVLCYRDNRTYTMYRDT